MLLLLILFMMLQLGRRGNPLEIRRRRNADRHQGRRRRRRRWRRCFGVAAGIAAKADLCRAGHQEEKDEKAAGGHEEAGYGKGEAPIGVDVGPGYHGAEDVAEGGVGVPEAHDEAAAALAKPVGHHCHHTCNTQQHHIAKVLI